MSKLIVRPKADKLPGSVVYVIIVLWLLSLVASVLTMFGASVGKWHIGVGALAVLNILAAFGLMRRRNGWRKFVLVELGLTCACAILLMILVMATGMKVWGRVWLLDREWYVVLSQFWSACFAIGLAALAGLTLRAITRPRVAVMFLPDQAAAGGDLVAISVVQFVTRMEGLQAREKHDAVESQIGKVDDAIAELQALRGGMSGPSGQVVLTENRKHIDDILARAIRVRDAHRAGGPRDSLAAEA